MLHAISWFLFLFGIWLALSGHFEAFLLVAGAVCSAIAVAIIIRMDASDRAAYRARLNWRLPLYWVWLAWQVVKANLDVARRVLSPSLPIDPVLERIPSSQTTDIGRVIYANSITLTPGTVSTDVGDGTIEVHALTRRGLEELRAGEMDSRVTRLEARR